jgi:hypothetical protein
METVQCRGAARRSDHGAKENCIGALSFHFIKHLIIVEAKRAAIENGYFRHFLFSNKRGDLRMERIDR